APVDAPTPGVLANGYSVRTAPPTTGAASSTATSRPWRARIVAATSPLWPAPITTTSTRAFTRAFYGDPPRSCQAPGDTLDQRPGVRRCPSSSTAVGTVVDTSRLS